MENLHRPQKKKKKKFHFDLETEKKKKHEKKKYVDWVERRKCVKEWEDEKISIRWKKKKGVKYNIKKKEKENKFYIFIYIYTCV